MLSREWLWPALVVRDHTFVCVSYLFGKICKIWCISGWNCAYLSSTSRISLSLWNVRGQGCWRQWWYQLTTQCRRDAKMSCLWFLHSTFVSSISWKCMSSFGVRVFFLKWAFNSWSLHCVSSISIVVRGYISSSSLWFANARFKSSCLLVSASIFKLHQCFETVIQFCLWLLFWALDFCHIVTLSYSIDTGVILKPWDCICNGVMVMYGAFNRQSWARTLPVITSIGAPGPRLSQEHLSWDLHDQ